MKTEFSSPRNIFFHQKGQCSLFSPLFHCSHYEVNLKLSTVIIRCCTFILLKEGHDIFTHLFQRVCEKEKFTNKKSDRIIKFKSYLQTNVLFQSVPSFQMPSQITTSYPIHTFLIISVSSGIIFWEP